MKAVVHEDDDQATRYSSNPLFINSTTYGTTYANWGCKPFERVREIGKRPFKSHFQGQSTYYKDFAKDSEHMLPPEFERNYDEKFYEDMKRRNQKGEFGSLLNAPFYAKSTTHEAFKKMYQFPKEKP